MQEPIRSSLEEKKLSDIAYQLSCPTGVDGIEMGALLNRTNQEMIAKSISLLRIDDRNRVLELGHGNCSHLEDVLKYGPQVKYFGLEISKTMQRESEGVNRKYLSKNRASFQLYDGFKIDYVSNFFERIFTVNTIYFWENPKALLSEIYRVLKPEGLFVLTFVNSNSMKNLPYVSESNLFELYDIHKLRRLIYNTNFEILDIKKEEERVKNKLGKWVFRDYLAVVLRKNKDANPEL